MFLSFREFIISRPFDYIFNAVVQVEAEQKVIVVFVVVMINTNRFVSPLLYASSTCAGPLVSVNLVLIYTTLSSPMKKSYMHTSRIE